MSTPSVVQPIKPEPTKLVKPKAKPKAKPIVTPRRIGQFLAAWAGGFLPLGAFWIAHHEVSDRPAMWVCVVFALMYSAPTLVEWVSLWNKPFKVFGHDMRVKAWGYAILAEGIMVFSNTEWLSLMALALLMGINCNTAWNGTSGKKV